MIPEVSSRKSTGEFLVRQNRAGVNGRCCRDVLHGVIDKALQHLGRSAVCVGLVRVVLLIHLSLTQR